VFSPGVLEPELVFEGVHDRLDPLSDEADPWLGAVGFVGAAGADDEGAELADGVFEVVAGVAFVADDELAGDRLAGEQGEDCLALGRACGGRGRSRVRSRQGRRRGRASCPGETIEDRLTQASAGSQLPGRVQKLSG
jgi:hypothetical protein